jgi:hypothetical protein
MRARMATMRMRRKKHRKPMMDQRRIWRTEGIVLESVKIGQYISDMKNPIMAKQMQRQAMYPKRRLYCNKRRISKLNINESAACGFRPKKGINIARHCVNGYCITATPAKSVTYVSF